MSSTKSFNLKMNKLSTKAKVALGMSGGVDSALSAHLLAEQGYDVTGIFLECWRAPGCRVDADRADALAVALDLGIKFQVLDFKDAYKQQVVENFFSEYEAGRTPNPDILCNKEIKFGLFYNWAMENGFDYVATGHYAKIDHELNQLLIPADQHKDQTYFLYRLQKSQLSHILFPLQDFSKQQVRAEAQKRQLKVASKPDSVGICFIGDINVHNFLEERLGTNPGEVVDTSGNKIGHHQGLWFYTIGQRHGFTVDKKSFIKTTDGQQVEKDNIPPFYVIRKNAELNQLVVGFGSDTLTQEFYISQPHWLNQPANSEQDLFVRIRHTGQLLPGKIDTSINKIILNQPTSGVAEGQSAVIYQHLNAGYVCLGGGNIEISV